MVSTILSNFPVIPWNRSTRPAATSPGSVPMDTVAPGVIDMRDKPTQIAFSAQQAANWAVDAAVQAASAGTFGVGGALIGPHHELLAISCNHVVDHGRVSDPTAHGERQLVDWYAEQVHLGQTLPPPEQCTIVSSLDPCVMCAGAILEGGFQVVSTTLDRTAGVNCHSDGHYHTMPEGLREQAQNRFGYLAVEGGRAYQGPSSGLGADEVIPAALEERALQTFVKSLDQVKETIHAATGTVEDVRHCPDDRVVGILKEHCPSALSVRTDPLHPGAELAPPLLQAARESQLRGGAWNAAALIDPHGNLVYLASGRQDIASTRTAFMELTRGWAQVRAEAGQAGEKYLAHLKDCTLVTLQAPGSDALGLMEMGAYGSSVEGPLSQRETAHWQYVVGQSGQGDLDTRVAALPPLYSQIIRPRIEAVSDPELKARCQAT